MIMDEMIRVAEPHVRRRIWVISDLQQAYPERATHCMTQAVSDFLQMGRGVDAICYLGDSVEGHDLGFIHEMSDMQAAELGKIDAPVYYVIGNHDFDYFAFHKDRLPGMVIPFMEYMKDKPQWHMPPSLLEMMYTVDMGDFALCLLTDHADPAGRWYTTHGCVRGDESAYPYGPEDYKKVWDRIAAIPKPVLTLSHYSFAGGNRAAPLFDRYLPLPENVRMHFYGHAHIGDAVWAGKDCHRKICAVDDQPIIQVNVASLENYRGTAVRSVMIEWYDTEEIGVLFRNHTLRCWDDCLVVRKGDGLRAPEDTHTTK